MRNLTVTLFGVASTIEQPKGQFSQDAGFAEILTRRKDDYIRHCRNEKETGPS